MIDIMNWIQIALTIIGGATVAFRIIAPLTKNKTDDKILAILTKVLACVALNKENNELRIKMKK